jgi:hypothetical protein
VLPNSVLQNSVLQNSVLQNSVLLNSVLQNCAPKLLQNAKFSAAKYIAMLKKALAYFTAVTAS